RRIYPRRPVWLLGIPVHCRVTRRSLALYPVSVRRIRVGGIGFLQIPPRGGHPCLALRFGPSPPAEDLHLLKQNIPGTQSGRRGNYFPRPPTPPDVLIVSGGFLSC